MSWGAPLAGGYSGRFDLNILINISLS